MTIREMKTGDSRFISSRKFWFDTKGSFRLTEGKSGKEMHCGAFIPSYATAVGTDQARNRQSKITLKEDGSFLATIQKEMYTSIFKMNKYTGEPIPGQFRVSELVLVD